MPPISATAAPPPPASATPAKPAHHGGFREFLSELNPLQYIPVVGTLYRAITGDTIPQTAREAGSLVVSFLTGGPIGAAINLGTLAMERITGFDPEKIAQRVLTGGGPPAPAKAAPRVTVVDVPNATPEPEAAAPPHAWSKAQLAAYGVTTDARGELQHGAVTGSDVLNDLELARHRPGVIA
jgi:hypothetical protein